MINNKVSMRIFDGRTNFWQWDTSCKLIIVGAKAEDEVHFWNAVNPQYDCKIYEQAGQLLVDIPDELFQSTLSFMAYTYVYDDDGAQTILQQTFRIFPRPQPMNYVYTPTERYTVREIVKEMLEDYDVDIDVDQDYDPISKNPQSGTAVKQAIDESLGDIDAALDVIIARQASIIGGLSE